MSIDSQLAERLGLSLTTLQNLQRVFAQHPAIQRVLVYGSRAKGNYRRGSDIDLTLRGPIFDHTELMRLEDQIDDLLLPYTVDLNPYQQLANRDLLEHIGRLGEPICCRSPESGEPNPSI